MADETVIQKVEAWAWQVAFKRIIAAVVGFLASQKAVQGLAWLEAHGEAEGYTYDYTVNPMVRGRMQSRIDRVYVSGSLAKVHSAIVIRSPILSDHFGLLAVIH